MNTTVTAVKNGLQNVSLFPNGKIVSKSEIVSIDEILNSIRIGSHRTRVEKLRALKEKGFDKEYDEQKLMLPAFTTSGIFSGGRRSDQLETYSRLVILDIDDLLTEEVSNAFEKIKSIPFTFSVFRSPSDLGLKIIVLVSSDAKDHKVAYEQVSKYYESETGLKIDPSGKDVSRLCFVSYDPDLYTNEDAETFVVGISDPKGPPTTTIESVDSLFVEAVKFTKSKKEFIQGNRNNFVHLLACNCNRMGIALDKALKLFDASEFNFDERETTDIFKSVYQRNEQEFARSASFARDVFEEDNAPFIYGWIYENLPEVLKEATSDIQLTRQRDMLLTAMLGVLSGCFDNVMGAYAQEEVYPNMFIFTTAPAASGKGILSRARQLAEKIHNYFIEESKNAFALYKSQLAAYKANDCEGEEPQKPPYKALFIAGNSSAAAFMKRLNETDESGIMFETEADTLSGSIKQDWGNFSDVLRKAYHHEPLSSSRLTNDMNVEIDKPRLSVILSGTPGQFFTIIQSAENGLFSRFIYYSHTGSVEWKDVSPNRQVNFSNRFEKLGNEVLGMADFLKMHPTTFTLTQHQWETLNSQFKHSLSVTTDNWGDEAGSSVKRMGLNVFRIAMLLSAIRKAEKRNTAQNIVCADIDFEIAMALGEVYLRHAMQLYARLPKRETGLKAAQNTFLNALPASFSRKEAVQVGQTLSIRERTVDKYLREFVKADSLKRESGQYQKI